MSQAKRRFAATGALPDDVVATLIDLYDGEILEVDDALGGLIDWLEEQGRLDRTLLVVTSDHGEKFGEHGEFGHSGRLWEAALNVPMYWHFPSPLRFPALRPVQRVHEGLACQLDVLPTVLGFLGERPMRDDLPGQDLVPVLYGKAPALERSILSEELVPGWGTRVLRTGHYKAMTFGLGDAPERVLIDLLASPDESVVLQAGDDDTGRLEAMHAELDRLVAEARRAYRPKPDEPPPDEQMLERLHELGYVR